MTTAATLYPGRGRYNGTAGLRSPAYAFLLRLADTWRLPAQPDWNCVHAVDGGGGGGPRGAIVARRSSCLHASVPMSLLPQTGTYLP